MYLVKLLFSIFFRNSLFKKSFKISPILRRNLLWFDFFEASNYSEDFIMKELNFYNIKFLLDKFPILLKIEMDIMFDENNHHSKQHFLLQEIQLQYLLYCFTKETCVKAKLLQAESIVKNKFLLI